MKKLLLLSAFITYALFSSAQTSELPTITIEYSGNTATVNIPSSITNVKQTVVGAAVTINSSTSDTEYCYKVTGTSSNGSLLINGSYKLTLELAGLTLSNPTGAAIDIECGKRIAVVLADGTTNTLSDCANGDQKAAMYFTGHPEFEGAGTLNVTGNTKHAISAKEYLEIKKSTGTINILSAVSDGIHCGKGKAGNENNYFAIKGGTVNINNVGGDCIDSDDYGIINIFGGTINYTVSANGGRGIKCYSDFTMTDGEIKANLTGGTLIEDADTSRCMAINVGNNMSVSGGKITVLRTNEASKAYKVKGTLSVSDAGQIILEGTKYTDSATDYQYDMTLYATATIDGKSITDYSNYQIGAFVGSECRGQATLYTVAGNENYAYLRLRSNTTTGDMISFRIFDASDNVEIPTTYEINFNADATVGTPGTPVEIQFSTDPTTIKSLEIADDLPTAIYTLSGIQVPSLQKGINIVRYANGTTKKIFR